MHDAVAVAVASVTVHSACEGITTLPCSRTVWGINCQILSLSQATAGFRAACFQSTLAGSHAWIPGLKATSWLHSHIHARELQHTSACAAGYTQAPKPAGHVCFAHHGDAGLHQGMQLLQPVRRSLVQFPRLRFSQSCQQSIQPLWRRAACLSKVMDILHVNG